MLVLAPSPPRPFLVPLLSLLPVVIMVEFVFTVGAVLMAIVYQLMAIVHHLVSVVVQLKTHHFVLQEIELVLVIVNSLFAKQMAVATPLLAVQVVLAVIVVKKLVSLILPPIP
jgi:hypothetical protein